MTMGAGNATCRRSTRSRTRACAPTRSPPWRASTGDARRRGPSRSARRGAIKEGRFDRAWCPSTSTAARARPRGVSAAADHEESLAGLSPASRRSPTIRFADGVPTFRELINQRYPDLEITHVHHAGNSSGVVDGAAAVLYAREDYVQGARLKPRARIVASGNMGDDPTLMLNAPVPRRGRSSSGRHELDDIDLFEINEAFAVVSEKFMRDLELDRDKVNVNGGAMALGHPIGATGAILIGTVLDELERQDKSVGLVTMCAGGGMAPAIIIERVLMLSRSPP